MKRRVLIVEDDALIAFEMEDILSDLGLSVCAMAATEDGAVAAAREHRPDLLMVDVRLARGDGIAAVARIADDLDVKVVYVTGNRDAVQRRDAQAICVNKPFNSETIEQAIRLAFGASGGEPGPSGGSDTGSAGGPDRDDGHSSGDPTRRTSRKDAFPESGAEDGGPAGGARAQAFLAMPDASRLTASSAAKGSQAADLTAWR